jgi:hypothetical protein
LLRDGNETKQIRVSGDESWAELGWYCLHNARGVYNLTKYGPSDRISGAHSMNSPELSRKDDPQFPQLSESFDVLEQLYERMVELQLDEEKEVSSIKIDPYAYESDDDDEEEDYDEEDQESILSLSSDHDAPSADYEARLGNIENLISLVLEGRHRNDNLTSDFQELLDELTTFEQHPYYSGELEDEISAALTTLRSLSSALVGQPVFSPHSIVVPEIVLELSDRLLHALGQDPALLRGIDARMFEELIAEIFRKFHMEVQLTKRTRDGGVDILAFEDTKYTRNQYIIECKHYSPERKVGLEIVQRLYGVKADLRATKAFLVYELHLFARRQKLWQTALLGTGP